MRKRTVTCIAKNIFWYLLYLLPWICVFVSFIFTLKVDNAGVLLGDSGYQLEEFFLSNAYMVMENFSGSDSLVTGVLFDIFGLDGIIPIFGSSYGALGDCIFMYFGYFVGIYLIHLCVDFLLFIPRLAHKWMNSLTSTEDCD